VTIGARFLRTSIFLVLSAAPALAAGLQATLDRDEVTMAMTPPTVLAATLRNESSAPLYVTGVKVLLSDGAWGDVYNPALLHERLLKLDAGQSWDGPLVVVSPSHRGPLVAKGSIHVIGGNTPASADLLASIPLQLTIADPRRSMDGTYDRGTKPVCDRTPDHCCDPSESSCTQVGGRCIYVAEGYDRQEVCIDSQTEKSYEHISDLQVSTDARHVAYIGSSSCLLEGAEEHCQRAVVMDGKEVPAPETPSHLALSPDGSHYAYSGRKTCLLRHGEEICTGPSHFYLDGIQVKTPPTWLPIPALQFK